MGGFLFFIWKSEETFGGFESVRIPSPSTNYYKVSSTPFVGVGPVLYDTSVFPVLPVLTLVSGDWKVERNVGPSCAKDQTTE